MKDLDYNIDEKDDLTAQDMMDILLMYPKLKERGFFCNLPIFNYSTIQIGKQKIVLEELVEPYDYPFAIIKFTNVETGKENLLKIYGKYDDMNSVVFPCCRHYTYEKVFRKTKIIEKTIYVNEKGEYDEN